MEVSDKADSFDLSERNFYNCTRSCQYFYPSRSKVNQRANEARQRFFFEPLD